MPYAMTQIQKRPSISEDMEPDIKFLVFAHHHNLWTALKINSAHQFCRICWSLTLSSLCLRTTIISWTALKINSAHQFRRICWSLTLSSLCLRTTITSWTALKRQSTPQRQATKLGMLGYTHRDLVWQSTPALFCYSASCMYVGYARHIGRKFYFAWFCLHLSVTHCKLPIPQTHPKILKQCFTNQPCVCRKATFALMAKLMQGNVRTCDPNSKQMRA
jgi:hypothetical protein